MTALHFVRTACRDGGNEIGKRFSDPRPGLDHQMTRPLKCPRHLASHLLLLGTIFVVGRNGKAALRREYPLDLLLEGLRERVSRILLREIMGAAVAC